MDRKNRITLLLPGLALLLTACSGSAADTTTTTVVAATTTAVPSSIATPSSSTVAPVTTTAATTTAIPVPLLDLSFLDLPFIPQGLGHYEGWLIIDGAPVSTGKFNANLPATNFADVNGDGIGPFPLDFDPYDATAFVLTIEAAGDTDAIPSDTHLLAGDIAEGVAELTINHGAALGIDFASAGGEFVLATPTDGDRTNDEYSGVWFLTFPGPVPGLDLPELPAGWTYEGWTVIDGLPVTTGTFLRVNASDDAAPYSGSVRTPNFPGEDYLRNAPAGLTFPTDLSGATVFITIEPAGDGNPLPFDLRLLAGPIPAAAELEPVSYPLTNEGFVAPTGTATLG